MAPGGTTTEEHPPSDDELIRKYQDAPASPEGRGAFDQLWSRHATWVEAIIRSLWDSVPAGYDRQLFFDESLQQTCVNLMQRLHGYRGPLAFPSYLREVVRTTVLDERRRVIAQLARMASAPSDDTESAEERPGDPLIFRSGYYMDPSRVSQVRERSEIIRQALAIHGQQSSHGVKSVVAIRWRWWEDRKIAEIAAIFRVADRTVFRLLADDYQALREILSSHFGIDHPNQI
jgi:RNA polymerase sigma factor (sigma-70 family)